MKPSAIRVEHAPLQKRWAKTSGARVFQSLKTIPRIIRLAGMREIRQPLSIGNIRDLLLLGGIDIRCGSAEAASVR
jgi:hypothetical protein